MPLQVIHVHPLVAGLVTGEGEDFALDVGFVLVKLRGTGLKQGRLTKAFKVLALCGVTCADQFFEPEALKILREIFGEIAPFGVVAGEKDSFAAEHVRLILQIRGHLLFNVLVLGVKLVFFCFFSC